MFLTLAVRGSGGSRQVSVSLFFFLMGLFLVLGGLDQVIDVDVEVVIELDEVDGGFRLHLVDDHARPLPAILFGVLHLFAHQTVDHLAGLPLRRHAVVYRQKREANTSAEDRRLKKRGVQTEEMRMKRKFLTCFWTKTMMKVKQNQFGRVATHWSRA